jgi:hypothetical protein
VDQPFYNRADRRLRIELALDNALGLAVRLYPITRCLRDEVNNVPLFLLWSRGGDRLY